MDTNIGPRFQHVIIKDGSLPEVESCYRRINDTLFGFVIEGSNVLVLEQVGEDVDGEPVFDIRHYLRGSDE